MVNRDGIYVFGPFQLDTLAHQLLKKNTPVNVAPKSFALLQVLVENRGRAMSKSELLEMLWPDTQVEEGNLAFQISVLRKALGTEGASWIETVPRHGYRFSAPVVAYSALEAPVSAPVADAGPVDHARMRGGIRHYTAAALVLVAITFGVFVATHPRTGEVVSDNRNATSDDGLEAHPVPLTTFPGDEANPALSPDGNQVAFTWNGQKKDNFDIYIMPISAGAPRRLTSNPADDASPAWSPDGKTIAFLRRVRSDEAELLLIPVNGGPEHKLAETRNKEVLQKPARALSIAWSPDGRWVAASHRESGDVAESIYLFSRTGDRRKLTAPPPEHYGDQAPIFSLDGRTVAFCRFSGWSNSDIYTLSLRSNMEPDGTPNRLTSHGRLSIHPRWSPDGHILYVFSIGSGRRELRIIDLSSAATSDRAASPKDDLISEISGGRHLVYSRRTRDINIWRATVPATGEAPAVPELFIPSTRLDGMPKYSPDGSKISFQSDRSGSGEVWVANADGANAIRLTSFGGPLVGCCMNWSPDGQWIVFHARPEGQADLFAISAAGGSPKRLTTDPADDTMPSYSHDGRWIYFQSRRTGQPQIWRMPAHGGEAIQITTSGGTMPVASPDGKDLFYVQWRWVSESAIWKIPVEGGHPVRVAGPLHPWPFAFAVTAGGLYYPSPPHSGDQRFIRFYSFSTGQSRPVAVTNRPFQWGITASPDGRYVAFDQSDDFGSDLMLVKNFRHR